MPPSVKHSLAWAGYKFTSTVLDDIWPQAVFFTGVATMVCCVSRLTSTDLGINSIMLSVLGTIVSLVVSFKTNNSYLRWWEGRNIWTNIATNSRQLAMLIWLQVPNRVERKEKRDKEEGAGDFESTKETDMNRQDVSSSSHGDVNGQNRSDLSDHKLEVIDEEYPLGEGHRPQQSQPKTSQAQKQEREEIEGLIEKKTYIGLIQAFAVAMKHSLRGEKGPFYSDLYSLIAFLPKYNPSTRPPITRDDLLVLWQNGIPRQKWHSTDDVFAVPLTQPASYDGSAFDLVDSSEKPTPGPTDPESNPSGLTTSSPEFKSQAIREASRFVNSDDPDVVGFAQLDPRDHRMNREKTPPKETEKVTIASVELMPPRHPPVPRYWDYLPPLRIVKIILDWFKTQKRLEDQDRTKGGKRRQGGNTVKSEIPQVILMYLSAYIGGLARRDDVSSTIISPLMATILELQKAISDLEKIATTPIPSAYSFHLRLTVWGYLLFLPFQVYPALGWLTIPGIAIASVVYLGFLEIGAQIESPFNYDQSDLDLDKFCLRISQQLAEITAFPTAIPNRLVVQSHLNQPFLPTCTLSVPQLLGTTEPTTAPTSRGFAASVEESDSTDKEARPAAQTPSTLPKSVRDLEMALNANWREVVDETKKVLGRQRDQLENKTGLEVAVLAL